MSGTIRVAAVQLRAHDRDEFTVSLQSSVAAAAAAAKRAQLVVMPEATLPAYVLGGARIDDAAIADALALFRDVARTAGCVIVIGTATRCASSIRNAAVVIDADGSIAGRSDKVFLWHFDRLWFEAGDRIAPVETAAGKLGALVCADGRLPTIARALVDRGAEILVMPTAWVTSGRNPRALENVQADLLARVRAFENGVPFVAANKCGSELQMVAYCGKSQIIRADGQAVAMAGEREPQILHADLPIAAAMPRRTPTLAVPGAPIGGGLDPVRIALAPDGVPDDIDRRLTILDDVFALGPYDEARAADLARAIAAASVSDDDVFDPAGLVGYRLAGYALLIWTTTARTEWIEPIARARALELRAYVVVFDIGAKRAFAVDPDGVVVAGTFDDYRIASFTLDPRRTTETTVAPGTDVREGLERVESIVRRCTAVSS